MKITEENLKKANTLLNRVEELERIFEKIKDVKNLEVFSMYDANKDGPGLFGIKKGFKFSEKLTRGIKDEFESELKEVKRQLKELENEN